MNNQDLPPDEIEPSAPVEKKAAQNTKNRGAKMTAEKRASQFDDLEVRDDGNCWCLYCHVPIDVKEKSTATKHVQSQGHKKRKLESTKVNLKPGPSAAVSGTGVPSQLKTMAAPTPQASPLKPDASIQLDLNKMLESLNTKDHITDDFVAAFLQAGIAPNKLDHPSIRGLIRKYTTVHGSVGKGKSLYRNVDRVAACHLGAIKKIIGHKNIWVGSDEWTDSQGHAIINVLMGSGPRAFVVATISLECKGKNDGVEHKELAEKVQDTVTALGVRSQDVIAFVSDSASVLKAAFNHELQPLYSRARHILCSSHTLNGVGSAMVAALPESVTRIFELGPAILHAKRQASRRRRWFAHLRSVGLKCMVPPKYIKTRRTIWRHCAGLVVLIMQISQL